MWESRDQQYCRWETWGNSGTWAVLRYCAEEVVVLALLFPLRRGIWEQLLISWDFLFLKATGCAASALVTDYSWALGSLTKLLLGSCLGKDAKQPLLLFTVQKGGSGFFFSFFFVTDFQDCSGKVLITLFLNESQGTPHIWSLLSSSILSTSPCSKSITVNIFLSLSPLPCFVFKFIFCCVASNEPLRTSCGIAVYRHLPGESWADSTKARGLVLFRCYCPLVTGVYVPSTVRGCADLFLKEPLHGTEYLSFQYC